MTAPVWLPIAILFGGVALGLIFGLPMAFTLGGSAIIAAFILVGQQTFTFVALTTFSKMRDIILIAMPLFIFMACVLEKSGVADDLYGAMHQWMGPLRGGLAMATVVICTVIAAMSGVSTAGVVTMGIVALPVMLRKGYHKTMAIGPILAGGALGILIPPSISFIVYAMLTRVSIGKLFAGGLIPGLILSFLYMAYIGIRCYFQPHLGPPIPPEERVSLKKKIVLSRALILPILLVVGVLGSIFGGVASPTEAAAIGAAGSIICAAVHRHLNWQLVKAACYRTFAVSGMVMWIIFGAICFSNIFIMTGSSELVEELVLGLEINPFYIVLIMMFSYLVLGCFVDELTILVLTLPIYIPILLELGYTPLWFGVLFIINMQVGYLSPPFGYTLFYMKAIAPPGVTIADIYRSILPFIPIQIGVIILVMFFPQLALWLPEVVFGLK